MADVIDFNEEREKRGVEISSLEDWIWACDCGCIEFILRGHGRIQCTGCKEIKEALVWSIND